MAKINKLRKWVGGVLTTIYPLTIPQAVVDPTSGKSVRTELDEKATSAELVQLAGDVSVKMTNVIANGDFSNGTIGWDTGGRGTVSIVGGYLNVMSNGTSNNVYGRNITAMPLVAGDKIYSMMEARVTNSVVQSFVIQYDGSTGGVLTPINNILLPTINTWYNMSGIATIPSGYSGVFRLYLYAVYLTAEEGNGLSHEIKRVITINLTKVFGAGNEPTKEEFELLLSILGDEYFEGEITIPAQKVMQWELALIRKNKNAIIALGGSII